MRLIDADLPMRSFQVDMCGSFTCHECPLLNDDGECGFEVLISDTPTVDAVPVVHGEWEIKIIPPTCGSDTIKAVGKCSKCGCDDSVQHKYAMGYYKGTPIIWSGFITNYNGNERCAEYFAYANANRMKKRNYCPNCGAKMDEVSE